MKTDAANAYKMQSFDSIHQLESSFKTMLDSNPHLLILFII